MSKNMIKFFGSIALFAFVLSGTAAKAGTKEDVTKKGMQLTLGTLQIS